MNTGLILIVIPSLIIFSYLFDVIAKKTKFPSVILLMITGILARTIADRYGFNNTFFLDSLIPVLGSIGLILIVMEGALELEIKKEKIVLMISGFFSAFVILILNIFFLKSFFTIILQLPEDTSILYSIPLSIISSAVAIPSANSFSENDKEFIVYESTFSDILGIVIFNYCILQTVSKKPIIDMTPMIQLGGQVLLIIFLSLLITYFLAKLIQKIDHHVKFFLIIAILILVYAIGKFFHFPTLLTIFIFGIFLGKGGELLPNFMKKSVDVEKTKNSLNEFHMLTSESTFLVRTFFFLFFGFSITLESFVSPEPYVYALVILFIMFVARYIYLSVTKLNFKLTPLVYMSPRGLISILLFLQLGTLNESDLKTDMIDERVLLLVILFSMILMLLGTLKKNINDDIPLEINSLNKEPESD